MIGEPRISLLEDIESRVIKTLSPKDNMIARGNRVTADAGYCGIARSGLECVLESLAAAGKPLEDVRRILDFPCGFGRVLRYLKAGFPGAEIVACDLLREGVDFCAETLGAIPVYSERDPARVPLASDSFDLVWVGSLLTHLDRDQWGGFLDLFRRCLKPGGVLVFTTHGRTVYRTMLDGKNYGLSRAGLARVIRGYERSGFGFAPDQAADYGISLTRIGRVADLVADRGGFRFVHIGESAWHGVHDVNACVKDDDADFRSFRPSTTGLGYHANEVREWLFRRKKMVRRWFGAPG